MNKGKQFDSGCMWEGPEWFIKENEECSGYSSIPCKHCYGDHQNVGTSIDGSTFEERVWVCPRVVVAYNEGGYASTGVCLDCILDAAAELAPNGEVSGPKSQLSFK